MKKTTRFALLFCSAFLSMIALKAQSWQPAGVDDANQPAYNPSNYNAIVSDRTGGVYVAHIDNVWSLTRVLQRRLSVNQWNGVTWQQVGAAGFSAGDAMMPQLAVGQGSVPYAIFRDMGVGRKVVVKTFNGSNWIDFGGGAVSAGPAEYPDIALGISDTVFIAYSDSTAGKKANVKKWNGTSWQTVGTANFSAANITSLRLVITGNNQPMVLAMYYNLTAEVFRFNGTAWVSLGNPADATALPDWGDLTLLKGDTALVAYTDYSTGYRVRAKKYDGSTWLSAGANLTPYRSTQIHLVRDTVNGPLMSCLSDTASNTYPNFTVVKRYNGGSSWSVVGPDSFAVKRYSYYPLAGTDSAHIPYLLVGDGAFDAKTVVRKLIGNSWQLLGTSAGFSNGGVLTSEVVAATDGKKAFCIGSIWPGSDGGPSKVYSYDTGWTVIGQSGINGWSGFPMTIAAHPDGNPWIVVNDSASPGSYLVWRRTLNGWMNTGFRDTGGPVSMCIDGGGTAYVVTQRYNNNTDVKVRKYTGSGWTLLPLPPLGNGFLDYAKLATSNTGVLYMLAGVHISTTPYYLYSFQVLKFDGTAWTQLGSIFNSANPTYHYGDPEIAIDTAGVPYIMYQNTAQQTPRLQRYDAVNNIWNDVVPTGSIPPYTGDPSIRFAPDGSLLMACADYTTAASSSVTVRRLAGNAWQTIGTASFAKTTTDYPTLAILNNRLLTVFTDGAAFGYKYDCPQPAIITQQPVDTIVCSGTTANFTLTATGATSYRWQYNKGAGWSNIPANSIYSGVSTNAIHINGVNTTMTGTKFRCVLTNTCGTTMLSNETNLFIDTAGAPVPAITIVASKQTICAGSPVKFTATASNTGFVYDLQWYLNNTIVPGANDSVFTTATLNDGDTVFCQITRLSACGLAPIAVQSNHKGITVISTQNATISISANPGTQIAAGQSVTFTATITNGGLAPTYQWLRNNVVISGATNSTYTTSALTDGDVIAAKVIRNDTCAAINPVTSSGLTMHVSSGITNIKSAYGIKVYPQPAQTSLYIDMPADLTAGNYTLQLFNTTGTEVLHTEIQHSGSTATYQVSLPVNIPTGLYLLKLGDSQADKLAEGLIMVNR